MPTIEEREKLLPLIAPHDSGFSPRYAARQASLPRPRTLVDMECQHRVRCDSGNSVHGRPPVTYRLWLEAGKLRPSTQDRDRSDIASNSSIWRNFRRQYSDYLSAVDGSSSPSCSERYSAHTVPEAVASMYPVSVPLPSKIGDFTYTKFLAETPLIKDKKQRQAVIRQVEKDLAEFKRLRLHSEMRDPPLTESGDIAPPDFFHQYPSYVPPEIVPREDPPLPGDQTQVDIFGRCVPKVASQRDAHVWKLEYRLNNPEYDRVKPSLARMAQNQNSPAKVSKQTIVLPPALCQF